MPSNNCFEQADKVKNQNKLPPKKRFGTALEKLSFTISKEPETQNNPWIQKQQKITNKTKLENNKPECFSERLVHFDLALYFDLGLRAWT